MTLLTSLQPSWPDHQAAVRVGDAALSRERLRSAAGAVAAQVAGARSNDQNLWMVLGEVT